jgi:hypothetical protein
MNTYTLKKSFCLIALISLTGCSAALKQMDLGIPGLSSNEQPPAKNISVDQLLAQARGQKTTHTNNDDPSELLLNFTPFKEQLSVEQKERLNRFANLQTNLMHVECALGGQADRFSAASVAINRCTEVSQFLQQRARVTEISLRPDLDPDLVKISQ